MTAIGHHSMMGSPNFTNSTIATVTCACTAAVVAAVLLVRDRLLERVEITSLLLF